MSSVLKTFEAGGYAYLPGGIAYSQGVVALPGHAVSTGRFAEPVPLAQAFERIAGFLAAQGRPFAALCALELRSPEALSFEAFGRTNARYLKLLAARGIALGTGSPVARSNVAPVSAGPAGLSVHAFSFTVRMADAPLRSFVVSGSSEWPQDGRFPEDVYRYGETSPEALNDKARWVLDAVERRMDQLQVGWEDATLTQSYCEHDVHDFLAETVRRLRKGSEGILWHHSRPPVLGWAYEMDVKGVVAQHFLPSTLP